MQERPVKPATIYVTDSSTGQNGDESLKAQEECCQEYSTTQGLEVQAVYRDPNGKPSFLRTDDNRRHFDRTPLRLHHRLGKQQILAGRQGNSG